MDDPTQAIVRRVVSEIERDLPGISLVRTGKYIMAASIGSVFRLELGLGSAEIQVSLLKAPGLSLNMTHTVMTDNPDWDTLQKWIDQKLRTTLRQEVDTLCQVLGVGLSSSRSTNPRSSMKAAPDTGS